MFNHAPPDYICPICAAIDGAEDNTTLIRKSDIVYQDSLVTAFIGSLFIANNPGQPIIVPNQHFENLYDLPDEEACRIITISRLIACSLKRSYRSDGVTVRQNNKPASSQHAFHYHMHLFPRYNNDQFDTNVDHSRSSTPEERRPYADSLRQEIIKELTAERPVNQPRLLI